MVEKLKNDMIEAMKNKEKERLTVIRMVKAAMDQEHIDHKREINDDLLIDVVNKQIKMRKDSIVEFEKGNRNDLIEKTQNEIAMKEATSKLKGKTDMKSVSEIIKNKLS